MGEIVNIRKDDRGHARNDGDDDGQKIDAQVRLGPVR